MRVYVMPLFSPPSLALHGVTCSLNAKLRLGAKNKSDVNLHKRHSRTLLYSDVNLGDLGARTPGKCFDFLSP